MKKYKLMSVGLGASILSIFGVMGCGPSISNQQSGYKFMDLEKGKMIEWRKSDLSSLKNYIQANQSQYPELTFNKLNSITANDLAIYTGWGEVELSDSKKKIIDQVEKLIIEFMFLKNEVPEVMKEINNWILHVGSQVFTSTLEDKGSGPWLPSDDDGLKNYYRKEFLNLQFNSNGLDFFSSRFKEPGLDTLVTYKNKSKPKRGDRVFDHSFGKMNMFTQHIEAASSWSIFRRYSSGEFEYTIDDKTKKAVFTKEPKNLVTLDKKLEIYFGGDEIPYEKVDEDVNGITLETPSLASKLNDDKFNKIKFKSKSGLNYAEVKSGKIANSGKEFKAKHLFYGFLRSLYAAKSLRQEGKINGVKTSLPKFTNTERVEWYKQFYTSVTSPTKKQLDEGDNRWDNKNVYILDLYNVDLKKTIAENKSSLENEFVIVFKQKGIVKNNLQMITDSTLIQPYYRKKPLNFNEANAKTISEFNEGERYKKGAASNAGVLSLAPYLYTKYSTNSGEELVLEKNPYYSDAKFVSDDKTIDKIIAKQKKDSLDLINFLTTRANNYKNAKKFHEYILDKEVLKEPKVMQAKDISNLYALTRAFRHGQHFERYNWNFNGFKSKRSAINDLGKKMLWGTSTDIGVSTTALDAFFTGVGAQTRAAIKAAINWQTVAKNLFPKSNMNFYGSIALKDSYKVSGIHDNSKYYPSYLSSVEDMQNIYDKNSGNRKASYTAPKIVDAAKTLDTLASQAGATDRNPAIIPIFESTWLEESAPSIVKGIYENIFARLNTLTKKVRFVPQEKFKNLGAFSERAGKTGDTLTRFTGYGPDYKGLGTTFDQYLRNYGSSAGVTMVKEALK